MLSLLLHQTLNPATRVQAEQELETFKKSPQFIETLVRDCHDPLCQIYLKNHIKQYSKLSPQDCAIIKNNVISLLQNRSKMLLEIVSTILLNDTWPELDIFIGQIITTNTVLALELILEKAKLVQWKSDGCDSIIALLPALLPLKMDLACYKALLKIYNSTIRLNLSDYHKSSIHEWVSLFTKIIQLETASVDEKSVEWKAKKWAHNCISTLFRYTGRKNCSDFSTVYLTSCVPALMPVYFDQISRFVQGQYLSERSKQLTCAFLELCIKPKPTWPILQQHLEQVITHFIYPLLCFTEDDQDLWDSNPVEYIHKKIDPPMDDFRSPVTAAEELLTTLVTRKFKTCFVPTVQIINSILTSYNELDPSLRDPRKKYGAMKLMTCIADLALGTSSPIKGQLHIFMAQHIFSELHSSTDWLRAAACHSLLKFARINYPQPEQLEFAFQSVIQALHDDKLPVRVMAALALYPYFEYPQIVQGMKPHITSVMQKMLDLTNEIDMDTLTHVMEQLVFEFSAELTPFATQLAQQLVMTFMRIIKDGFLDKQNDDPDEAEEKIMAATGVLKTISSLCLSLDSSVSILLELEMVVTPCITIVLENSILDLFEECFEILETLTFVAKQISPTMWSMFPLIVSTFKADGRDYFEDMLPTLDNLISYGRDQIMANPAILSEFVDVIMIIMSSSPEERGESDFCRACQLMESIMLNLVSIDHVVEQFIRSAHAVFSQKKLKSAALKVHLAEVIINALRYNPVLALSCMESLQFTQYFFQFWFKNLELFTRVHDKKLCILALCSILSLPQLPDILQNQMGLLFDGVLDMLKSYPEAVEIRQTQEALEHGSSQGYEEDDEFIDDGPIDTQEYDAEFEDTGYLEQLSSTAASYQLDDESEDDWSVCDFMEEDVYLLTPLDSIDVYKTFLSLVQNLETRGLGSMIAGNLSQEKQAVVTMAIKSAQQSK